MSPHSSTSCYRKLQEDLQIFLFFFSFLSFPRRMEDSCPDMKSRIILIAQFSDSGLVFAPWRAKLGFCFLLISLLAVLCADEKLQPLAWDLSSSCQYSISWFVGKLLPVMTVSKEQSQFLVTLKPVAPSDIIHMYIINKHVCLQSL